VKVLWRGKLDGHDTELVVCHHEGIGTGLICLGCGRVRLADWLPLLPYRFYRPAR